MLRLFLWAVASKCSKLRHLKRKYVIINLMERGSEFQYIPLLLSVRKESLFEDHNDARHEINDMYSSSFKIYMSPNLNWKISIKESTCLSQYLFIQVWR